MIFHPLHRWIYKGPFTTLFYTFLGSDMPWSSKLSILAYMCSYFALASALLLSLVNYCIIGWFRDELSSCYLTSWNVLMSLIVVFNILGQVALALLRYRTGERSLLGSLVENFKWSPLMTVFFGGVAFHISLALLAHLFHIDMQWGATSKEKKDSNFFQEVSTLSQRLMQQCANENSVAVHFQDLQVDVPLRNHHRRRHDIPRRLCASGLENRRLHRHRSSFVELGLPRAGPSGPQPFPYGLHLLDLIFQPLLGIFTHNLICNSA